MIMLATQTKAAHKISEGISRYRSSGPGLFPDIAPKNIGNIPTKKRKIRKAIRPKNDCDPFEIRDLFINVQLKKPIVAAPVRQMD